MGYSPTYFNHILSEDKRQGDIYLHKISNSPLKLPSYAIPKEGNILAYGEASGHKHQLVGGQIQIFQDGMDKQEYVLVTKPTILKHEEHEHLQIEEGTYMVIHEREYDPFAEEIRKVED